MQKKQPSQVEPCVGVEDGGIFSGVFINKNTPLRHLGSGIYFMQFGKYDSNTAKWLR